LSVPKNSGKEYSLPVGKDISLALVYVEDAARALVHLGKAPRENIKTVNYFINGVQNPLPNVGEMVEAVRQRIPGSRLSFDINSEWQRLLKSASHPVDDSSAIAEWDWTPLYESWEKVIEAYLRDMKR
jgi:nucleoside-diphosphate-sugar epimerase